MQQLEKPLADAFKGLPPLPENVRKGLASAMPWLVLAGGVLSLLGAYYLYQAVTWVNQWAAQVNSLYAGAYSTPVAGIGVMAWVGLVILAAQAVLFFMAYPALRAYKKRGWDLVFWAALISVVYGVVANLLSGYANIGQLLFSLLGSAVGMYLLFQIRQYYSLAGSSAPKEVADVMEKNAAAKTAKPAGESTDDTAPKV
jgi:hypothetical protein